MKKVKHITPFVAPVPIRDVRTYDHELVTCIDSVDENGCVSPTPVLTTDVCVVQVGSALDGHNLLRSGVVVPNNVPATFPSLPMDLADASNKAALQMLNAREYIEHSQENNNRPI